MIIMVVVIMVHIVYSKIISSTFRISQLLIPIVELSDYFDYIEYRDVFFTIVMLMLVCHNCASYSGFKDP